MIRVENNADEILTKIRGIIKITNQNIHNISSDRRQTNIFKYIGK